MPAKDRCYTAGPRNQPFGVLTLWWAQGTMYYIGVHIPTSEGAILASAGHDWQSIYSKRLSRGQHRYSADADWNVLDAAHIGSFWHHLPNMTKPSTCGGDAALCQITLTSCYKLYTK